MLIINGYNINIMLLLYSK